MKILNNTQRMALIVVLALLTIPLCGLGGWGIDQRIGGFLGGMMIGISFACAFGVIVCWITIFYQIMAIVNSNS